MNIIDRSSYKNKLIESIKNSPITALIGPRQCGKSTLAREVMKNFGEETHFLDLEDITDLERLENTKLALDPLNGLIVIDEIQRKPELFPYLRVLVDKFPNRRYLILGSASRDLIESASETLAGRISYTELTPFTLLETKNMNLLLERGGFPRSFLSSSPKMSLAWRKDYIQSYLERELKKFGVNLPSKDIYRFWMMLAHYHGNIINYSEIGRSLGISDQTVRKYIFLLEDTFMIRLLQPWYENIAKRQTKSPKLYIRDSGILQALLDITPDNLLRSPKLGAIWEGFAVEEIIRCNMLRKEQCYFWQMISGAELDLLIATGDKQGFEIKYSDHPKITSSMTQSMEILNLNALTVVTPLRGTYKLREDITVVGLEDLLGI